jgi:hypothetical protein
MSFLFHSTYAIYFLVQPIQAQGKLRLGVSLSESLHAFVQFDHEKHIEEQNSLRIDCEARVAFNPGESDGHVAELREVSEVQYVRELDTAMRRDICGIVVDQDILNCSHELRCAAQDEGSVKGNRETSICGKAGAGKTC